MCFNYKVSLLTFVIGTVGSIALIKYGALQYKLENTIFGTLEKYFSWNFDNYSWSWTSVDSNNVFVLFKFMNILCNFEYCSL